MKFQKIMTVGVAGLMAMSLAACGNKSATETHKSTAESSHVVKKHDSKKKSSLKVAKNNSKQTSSTQKSSNNNSSKTNENVVLSGSSAKAVNSSSTSSVTTNSSANTSSIKQSNSNYRYMSADDARNLVKEHISNQRANALAAGKSAPAQPSVDDIDGYSVQKNGNGYTVSGTSNGHSYSYNVSATAVTGN